jgi:hypothetical protein
MAKRQPHQALDRYDNGAAWTGVDADQRGHPRARVPGAFYRERWWRTADFHVRNDRDRLWLLIVIAVTLGLFERV